MVDIIPFSNSEKDDGLRLAACLEEHFPHSMANIRRKLGSRPGHNNYIMNELGVGDRLIDADHDGPDAPAGHEENA